ncbi:MAG: BRO family protein [Verrucomicrobiota bacterium]
MNHIIEFNHHQIRMAGTPETPEWVGKDVCDLMGYREYGKTLGRLPEDERGSTICQTLGGPQEMITVTEPGLYRLIFGSKLPAAETFKSFVLKEVLPSIRKNGFYPAEKSVEARFLGLVRELQELKLLPHTAVKIARTILKLTDDDVEIGDMTRLAEALIREGAGHDMAARTCREIRKRFEIQQAEKRERLNG